MSRDDDEKRIRGLASIADPRALLEGLFQNSPVAFQVYNAEGHSLFVNQAFRDLFESEPPPDYNILKDEIAARRGLTDLIKRAFAGETISIPGFWYDPRELEHVNVDDGRRVGIAFTMFPLLDADKQIRNVAICFKDVTAELERQRERDYLRALQESSVEITTIHHVDRRAQVVSPSVKRLLGHSEEEFAANVFDLIHPDDQARINPDDVLRNPGVPQHTEYRLRHKDGSWRWMSVTATNLVDHPTIAGVIAHHHDITELRETTDALRQSQEELAATLNSIGDGVIATDAEGRVTRMNPVAAAMTGWAAGEAIGRPLDEVFHIVDEDSRRAVESPVARVLRDGIVVGLANHTALLSLDGSERAIADSAAPIRGPDGALRGVVLVFRDQTEERRIERALQRAAARQHGLAEAGRRFAAATSSLPALLDLVGAMLGELVGGTAAVRLAPALHDPPPPGPTLVVPLRVRDVTLGSVLLVRGEPSRPYSDDERLLAQDLADRAALAIDNARLIVELEERVAQRTAALHEANVELEAFSYSVAHDLRGPLRAINGFASILAQDHAPRLDADGKSTLARIGTAADRMGERIDALLSLARVARAEIRREPVDLGALAQTVVAQLRQGAPDRQVELVVGDDLGCSADAALVKSLLENLLGNAWKFTAGRTPARIELGRDGDGVFYVKDNGAGFDMAHTGKLFQPFQRLHKSHEFEGTGIGLATVQRIVRRHGGRLWAEAAVGAGATFHFTLGC